jgi:tRNA(Ile)-lysidine synthase
VRAGGNLQARARDARRAALEEAARLARATRIATAHHADDRAETVLIRLLSGAAPVGLAVLPPQDGAFIRPMIRARKSDVVQHLARHQIPFSDDPSNLDPRFLRVRIRLEVLPLLEELSPSIVQHLTGLADDLAAGPTPPLADEAGRPVALRRAHVRALRLAVALGRPTRIRLARGMELVAELEPGGRELAFRGSASGRVGSVRGGADGQRSPIPDRPEAAAETGKRPPANPPAPRTKKGGVKPRKSG